MFENLWLKHRCLSNWALFLVDKLEIFKLMLAEESYMICDKKYFVSGSMVTAVSTLPTSAIPNAKSQILKGVTRTLPFDQCCGCKQRKYHLSVSAGFHAGTHSNSIQTDPDDLLKHFDSLNFPEEHSLIENMYNDTENEYTDLCDGTRNNLLVLPCLLYTSPSTRD